MIMPIQLASTHHPDKTCPKIHTNMDDGLLADKARKYIYTRTPVSRVLCILQLVSQEPQHTRSVWMCKIDIVEVVRTVPWGIQHQSKMSTPSSEAAYRSQC